MKIWLTTPLLSRQGFLSCRATRTTACAGCGTEVSEEKPFRENDGIGALGILLAAVKEWKASPVTCGQCAERVSACP